MTRHQPISIPSRPRRGRECQWPQPGSPTSAREIRSHLYSAGSRASARAARGCAVSSSARSRERHAGVGDPVGERVAHPLELAEAERPRLAETAATAGVDLEAREGLGDERDELVLEAADLAAQLGSREALVAADAERTGCVSDEQIRT